MEPSGQIWIETVDGCRLDADLLTPAGPSDPVRGGIVVAHPHPLYGGNRQHPIVTALSNYAAALGWIAIRFDFRGTGRSTGSHSKGVGEILDMEAALSHLATLLPADVPLVAAGYSFGAVMALSARSSVLTHRVGIAAPLSMLTDTEPPHEPTFLLVPSHDQYTPPDEARAVTENWPQTATMTVIEGADHFLNGFAGQVTEQVMTWLMSSDGSAS